MSAWIPDFSVVRWCLCEEGADEERERRRKANERPLVLVSYEAHGTKIGAVNKAARASGAREGMYLPDARAIYPALAAEPFDPRADKVFLKRLALWSQRWGPSTAIDPPDGILVDVTAVAHLFGGEARLIEDAQRNFTRRGIPARFAIAPTSGAAWALARFGPRDSIIKPEEDVAGRVETLPIAGLRLDDEVLTVLKRLGLKRIGEVAGIGRDALHRRFRRSRSPAINPLVRLDQMFGLLPEPLMPVVRTPLPLVQRRLLEPIRHREALDRVVRDLAQDMVRELEGKGEGARQLELGMWRVDGEVQVRQLELAAATRDAAHICRLFTTKLDDVDAGFGIEMIRMRATWPQKLAMGQMDMDKAAECRGTSLATCLDRLSVRLGDRAVRRPIPAASYVPERAQKWGHPIGPDLPSQEEFPFHNRPLKLLVKPERINVLYASPDGYPQRFSWRGGVHRVVRTEGPERIAPEWWRERSDARLRDYYRVEDDQGRRYWIYRYGITGDGRGGAPEWFLQGLSG